MEANSVVAGGVVGVVLTAIVTVIGLLFREGKLGNVIASSSKRQETAVEILGRMADKAIDGLVQMSGAMERMAADNSTFQREEGYRFQTVKEADARQLTLLESIAGSVTSLHDNQVELMRLIGTKPIIELKDDSK